MSRGYRFAATLSGAVAVALFTRIARTAAGPPAPAVGTILTVAGTGKAGHNGDGGPAVQATINSTHGLLFDHAQRLYLVDSIDNRVRRIGLEGVITTVAGQGIGRSAGDNGPATSRASRAGSQDAKKVTG